MQQRQMQAHVGTRWHKSIVAFAVSRSFALQVALLLQWDMLVSWNSSFDASVWLHFGILVSGDTLPDGTSMGQHDSVDFKPLSH